MRERRQERREQRQEDGQEFGRRGTATKYKMREKLVSFGDDFWIENEQGQRAFKVDGKMLRVRDTLIFESPQGQELVKIQAKMLSIRGQMRLERSGGASTVVKKDMINIVRDHMVLLVEGQPEIDIRGNLLDHEYTFSRGRDKIAEVSKKWFRFADTYGVEIEPGADDVLILAATVAIDQLSHDMG
ncbi:MAG: hypothetical protein HGA45_37725 [Chloroflexales bacterium]|nr:hypothetical protein [Chloroflexales bacterium]